VTPNHDIGQPVTRTEDAALLAGRGRYTDDLNEPGQPYAYVVRSPYEHGVIKGIDFERARRNEIQGQSPKSADASWTRFEP
jgi:CO/xanthine dehydrogenase Mo-binding subunit